MAVNHVSKPIPATCLHAQIYSNSYPTPWTCTNTVISFSQNVTAIVSLVFSWYACDIIVNTIGRFKISVWLNDCVLSK